MSPFFLKQVKVGAEQISSGKSFQTVEAPKAKLWPKCFLSFMYRMRNLQEPFIWTDVCCTISSTMSRQKIKYIVTGMTTVKELVN